MGTIRDEIIQLVQRSVKTFSSIENADRQLTGLQTLNQMKRDLARNRIKEALHEIQVVIAKQAAEDLLELSNLVKEREEELTFEKVNLRTTKETLLSLLKETKEVILSRPGDIDRRQAEILRDKMKELVETDFSPIHLEAFSYLEFISHQKKPEDLCVGYLRTGVLDPRQMSLNEVPGHTEQILEVGQSAALWLDTGAPISCQDLMKHAVVSVTGPGGDALACKMYELDSQIRIGFNVKEEGPYIVDVKVYKAHVSPCPMTLWAMNRETSKGLRANIMRSIDQSQSHQHLSVEPSRDFLRTDEAEMEDEPAVFEPARPEPTRPQPTQPPLARPEPTQPQRTQSDPARPDPATSPLTASSPTPRTYGPRARRLSSPGIGPPPGFTEGYMASQETSHVKECAAPPGFRKGHLGFDAGHAFSRLSLEDKKPPGLSVQPPRQTAEVSTPARHERSDVTDVPPIVIQPIEMSPLRTPKIKMEPVVVEKPTSTRWSPQKTVIPTPTPSGANSQSWRKTPSQQEQPTRSETNTKQTVQPKPDTVQHKDVNTNKKLTVKDIPLPKEPYSTPPLTEITQPKHKEPLKQRSFGEREKELRKENEPPKQRSFVERERPKAAQRAVSKEALASGDHHQTAPGDKTMPSFSYLTNLLNLRHGSNTDIPAKLTLELGKRGTGTPYVFAFPIGIATSRSKDEPDIIACDTGNNLVKIFTWAGKFKKALGTEEDEERVMSYLMAIGEFKEEFACRQNVEAILWKFDQVCDNMWPQRLKHVEGAKTRNTKLVHGDTPLKERGGKLAEKEKTPKAKEIGKLAEAITKEKEAKLAAENEQKAMIEQAKWADEARKRKADETRKAEQTKAKEIEAEWAEEVKEREAELAEMEEKRKAEELKKVKAEERAVKLAEENERRKAEELKKAKVKERETRLAEEEKRQKAEELNKEREAKLKEKKKQRAKDAKKARQAKAKAHQERDVWQQDTYGAGGGGRRRSSAADADVSHNGGPGKLLISNLDYDVDDSDISVLFAEFGPLIKAAVQLSRKRRSLGKAEVVFERQSDAAEAMRVYNNVLLDGRPMDIQLVDAVLDQPPAGLNTLLISNLDFDVTGRDIRELFSKFGPLRHAAVDYDQLGRSLGTAEVVFERMFDAASAMREYSKTLFDGLSMNVQLVDAASNQECSSPWSDQPPASLKSLFISNLDFDVTSSDIGELFSEFGPLQKAAVHYDRSHRSLGTAEVVFERKSDAAAVMREYNHLRFDGRAMTCFGRVMDIAAGDASSVQPPDYWESRQRGGDRGFSRGGCDGDSYGGSGLYDDGFRRRRQRGGNDYSW